MVVALSVLIAVIAAYTALDMATRVLAERGRRRLAWLLGGSIAMGTGIWSMHFVGMLAFELPFGEAYDGPLTAASAAIAIAASGVALLVVSRERRLWTLPAGGLLFGFAISGMHYTGMAAMRMPASITYDPLLVTLSIAIAVAAACGALWIMFRLESEEAPGLSAWKMAGGVVLGFAIVGMHYTAMAAAEFTPTAAPMSVPRGAIIGTDELTAVVVISTFAILGLALVAAAADRKRRLLVAEQARREAAESARERIAHILESITDYFMALDREWRLTYVNAGAANFFGRPREELVGERLWDLVPDGEGGGFHQQYQRALERNTPVRFEEESAVAPGQWVEVQAYPSDDGLAVYFRDITERRQAERALQVSEERYRQLFERSPIGVYRSTPAGELLAANPAMVRMLGYDSLEELSQYNIAEVGYASPEDRHRFRDLIEREGEVEGLEAVWLRRDGTELYVRENARPIRAEDGTILYFEGTVEDVTDRKRAEDALRRQKEFSSSLISSSQDGILAFDRELRYTVWNPAMEAISGMPADNVLGRVALEVFPFLKETGEDEFFRAALEGRSTPGEDRPYTVPETGRSGYFRGHYSPIRDAEGEVVGGLAIIRDVTERRDAEDKLRRSEERFRELAEHIREVFWVLDPVNKQVLYLSPAWEDIFGVSAESAYEDFDSLGQLVHPEDRERMAAARERLFKGKHDEEYRIIRADGQVRRIHARGFPVRNEDGELVRVVGIAEDVTDQRELEEQLLQSRKMDAVGQLAGGIAHDFNNLLTAIQGHSRLLLEEAGEEDPLRDHATEITNAAERASRLTRQLLTFSRREIVQPRRLDMNAVVLELEDMLRRLLGADIDRAIDLTDDDPCVTADPSQIQQVVLNLALNARDAMEGGGSLRLSTARVKVEDGRVVSGEDRIAGHSPALVPGAYSLLRVEDTGHGIDPDIREHIFEPFFSTREQGTGTGLGLSTVHGIVEQNGGAIQVESEPGAGTTFTVYLPCAEDVDEQDPLEDRSGGHPARLPVRAEEAATATVLLVEDEPAVRSLARKVLTRYGYRVIEAENGRRALQVADEHDGELDLVLTDVVMPEMGGRALVEKLRERRPETAIIYMSGYTRDEVVRRGIFRSEVPFLEKPFSPRQLLSIVQDQLGRAGE